MEPRILSTAKVLQVTQQPLKRFIGSSSIEWMVLNGKTRGFLMILVDFYQFSVFFEHFWSIFIPGGFVRPRENSRHTNSARRIETGRLEALEIPQIPRKIDFELVFWAGPGPGQGPDRARPGLGPRPRPSAAAVSSPCWGQLGRFFFQKMTLKI